MDIFRVDAASAKSLTVRWAAGSVNVSVTEGADEDAVEFWETSERDLSEGQRMRWSTEGDALKIDYGRWLGGFMFTRKDLNVRIPRAIASSLNQVRIDGSSGSYRVEGIGCNVLSFKIASGKANVEDVAAQSLHVDLASGALSAMGRFAAGVKLRVASGETRVFCVGTCPREVDVDAASGKVRLALPKSDGFTVRLTKASGKFASGFPLEQQGNVYRYGDGSARIGVRLASGSMALDCVG